MIDISRGVLDRKRPVIVRLLKRRWDKVVDCNPQLIDKNVMKFAEGIANSTDLQIKQVLKSNPVKAYRDRLWFREKNKK